ncbi:MAG: hypothetical protein E7609_04415, partial [Ruminococcaceae bacterium]|nr:hypothetical protein [Oscillospiraceae bacterium]
FHKSFVSKFCCSIFKDRCPQSRFFATALLLYHTLSPLSTPFFKFFQVFLDFFLREGISFSKDM